MASPTEKTRKGVYLRDGHRCVTCGNPTTLEFQHRRRVGAGGSKILPAPVDGLTLCHRHNRECEAEMQTEALRSGWKVRAWVRRPELVPVYYPLDRAWFRLEGLFRIEISRAVAMEMGCSVYGAEWLAWHEVIA
ncbi:hypothetical protein CQ047_18295 [Microbacterium sp. MYb72]|uniref:hypothetical protein n=1 Tax=Microbacterium sp. MYb72 TaxID=1848693 RepID=UPI000CFBC60B|nr:hypothetical protein [Microbacterium sp. MYb72]PRB01809.1 hypothetical protein CQ047_18295 [Microbacterium sp. MYb72]